MKMEMMGKLEVRMEMKGREGKGGNESKDKCNNEGKALDDWWPHG